MCNIHGYVNGGKKDSDISGFLTDGFIAGQVRGMDSSGMTTIEAHFSDPAWHKLPVCGSMFVQDKFAKSLLTDAAGPGMMTICHTRLATSGKVGLSTAHPFVVEREGSTREFIGVHNGTLSTWRSHASAKEFDVDSEWALNQIYERGLAAFEDFMGAFCMVWWDSEDNKVLNIALNDERHMFVAFTTDGGMAYASEGGMLYWLLERNKLKLSQPIIQLKPENWYKFDIDELTKFKRTELPLATYYMPANNTQRNYTHVTVVDKMNYVLGEIAKKEEAANKPAAVEQGKQLMLLTNKPKTVTKAEVKLAKEFGIQNEAGFFQVSGLDSTTDELYGTYFYGQEYDKELDAVIRNAASLKFDTNDVWDTTAIGLIDDNGTLSVVCSRPKIKLLKDKPANVSKQAILH